MANGQPETESIDRLFLELSQFTSATTGKELKLKRQVDRYGLALMVISEGCAYPRKVAVEALTANTK